MNFNTKIVASSGAVKTNGKVFYGSWCDNKIIICDLDKKDENITHTTKTSNSDIKSIEKNDNNSSVASNISKSNSTNSSDIINSKHIKANPKANSYKNSATLDV